MQLFHNHLVVVLLDHEAENFPSIKEPELKRQHFGHVIGRGEEAVFQVDGLGGVGCVSVDHHVVRPEVHMHDALVMQGAQQVERQVDQAADVAAFVQPLQAVDVVVEHFGEDEEFLDQTNRGFSVAKPEQVGDGGPALLCGVGVDDFFDRPIEGAVALCTSEGHSQFGLEAVEGLEFGEEVAFHALERGADAVLQLVPAVNQLLDRQFDIDIRVFCQKNSGFTVVEYRGKTLKHTSVGENQNTSLSLGKCYRDVTRMPLLDPT